MIHEQRPAETSVLFALLAAAHTVRAAADRCAAGAVLTATQSRIAYVLRDAIYGKPQTEIVRLTALTPAAVSTMVARMERHGLAVRAQHPMDRRSELIALTERGAAEWDGAARRRAMFDRRLAHLVGVEPAALAQGLDRVAQAHLSEEALCPPVTRTGNSPSSRHP